MFQQRDRAIRRRCRRSAVRCECCVNWYGVIYGPHGTAETARMTSANFYDSL